MSDQSSQDRTGLCIFTFDDGRHCNMPHTGNELRLCYFHEKKELQNLHTACDLSAAFVMLFRAGVQGHTDPKTLNALTKLGNLVVKTHLLAKDEYLSTYDREWPYVVEQSLVFEENPATSPASSFQPAAVPQAKPSEQSKAKQSA